MAAIYTLDYKGYRADPLFERSIRAILSSQIASRTPPPADILDVGCGSGDFLAAASELGYQVKGIDISDAGPAMCRARGFDAVSGDFLAHDFGQKFDIITMWDVIEHLPAPAAFLDRARGLLKPGGFFVGKVPAFGDLSVSISRTVPSAAGRLLGAPSHIQYFQPRSMEALILGQEMRVEWLEPGITHMRSRMRGGSLRKRLGRYAGEAINKLSGDRNLYFIADPA